MSTKTIAALPNAGLLPPDTLIEVEANGVSRKVRLDELEVSVLSGFVPVGVDPAVGEQIRKISETVEQIVNAVGSGESAAAAATDAEAARRAAMVARAIAEAQAGNSEIARRAAVAARDVTLDTKKLVDLTAEDVARASDAASTSAGLSATAYRNAVRLIGNSDFDNGFEGWVDTQDMSIVPSLYGATNVAVTVAGTNRVIVGPAVRITSADQRFELRARWGALEEIATRYYVGVLYRDATGAGVAATDGTGDYPLGGGELFRLSSGWIERKALVGKGLTRTEASDAGYVDHGGTVTIPTGAVTMHPVLFLNYDSAPGSRSAVDYFRIADITDSYRAGTAARASTKSAETAAAHVGDAEEWASASRQSATDADTAAGTATTRADEASRSAKDADGSKVEAARLTEITASSERAAGQALAATFPRVARPAAFTIQPDVFASDPIPDQPGVVGRIVMDTRIPLPAYAFGLWTQAVMPFVVGKRIRLTALLEWVDGSPDQPAAVFHANYYNAAGVSIADGTVGPNLGGLPPNQRVTKTLELTMGSADGAPSGTAFVRYAVLVNRKPASLGQTTVGRTDIHAFYPEDITSEQRSADNARASSSSAETAGVHSDDAGKQATAARDHRLEAARQTGLASGFADASQRSAGTAGDHATAALSSQRVAAGFAATRGMTVNGRFEEGVQDTSTVPGWAVTGGARWRAAWWVRGPGVRTAGSHAEVHAARRVRVDPSRTYRLHYDFTAHSDDPTPRLIYIGLACFDGAGTPLGNVYVRASASVAAGTVVNESWDYTGVSGTAPVFGHGRAFVTGTVEVRPLALLNYHGHPGTSDLNALWLEDVTSEVETAAQAVVANDARVASERGAVSAATSAIVSAQVSSTGTNRGGTFTGWPDGQSAPTYWSQWADGGAYRVDGLVGRYAAEIDALEGRQWGLEANWNTDAALANLTPNGWWVVEADIELLHGQLAGAGLYWAFYDGNSVGNGYSGSLPFHSHPDTSGVVRGAGVPGRRYTFASAPFRDTGANGTRAAFYAMANWTAFGVGLPYKRIRFHKAIIRPATQAEIDLARPVTGIAARVDDVRTAIADGRFAAAQTVQTLRVEYDGTAAEVVEQRGAITGVEQRTAAYLRQGVIAGSNRVDLTLWADANAGAGVNITGDVAISGDLLVGGSIVAQKFNRPSMSREGSSAWSGSVTPDLGQSLMVPWSLTLPMIPAQGRFFWEMEVALASNAGTQTVGTHNGMLAYTNNIDDGGLELQAVDNEGNVYAPRPNASAPVRSTTPFTPTFAARVRRGSLDTGWIQDGDYYYRNISASYTVTRIFLKVTWIAI